MSDARLVGDAETLREALWQHRLITESSGDQGCVCGEWSACEHAKHQADALLASGTVQPREATGREVRDRFVVAAQLAVQDIRGQREDPAQAKVARVEAVIAQELARAREKGVMPILTVDEVKDALAGDQAEDPA